MLITLVYILVNKILYLSKIDKIDSKPDAINGSVVNGIPEPIFFSFLSNKLPGYKTFCEPETVHFKIINKSVLKTMTFYLEDDNNEEVDFNGETLIFTLQMIKI